MAKKVWKGWVVPNVKLEDVFMFNDWGTLSLGNWSIFEKRGKKSSSPLVNPKRVTVTVEVMED